MGVKILVGMVSGDMIGERGKHIGLGRGKSGMKVWNIRGIMT
jgi:hypothetical protein